MPVIQATALFSAPSIRTAFEAARDASWAARSAARDAELRHSAEDCRELLEQPGQLLGDQR